MEKIKEEESERNNQYNKNVTVVSSVNLRRHVMLIKCINKGREGKSCT